VPFTQDWSFAVGGDRLYAGRGGTPEIRVYDRRGTLIRLIRWVAQPAPVTTSDRERYESVRLQLDERVRPGITAQVPALTAYTLPDTKPLFAQLIVDDDGCLWVRQYPELEELLDRGYGAMFAQQDRAWWLFAPSGRLLGSVTMPPRFTIKDIRNGVMVGLLVDDDDVVRLHLLPLKGEILNPR